jgi:predicted RNA polymerase sigma factor
VTEGIRGEQARRRREDPVARRTPDDRRAAPAADEEYEADRDDTLTVLFLACHPSLTPASAIALTLRSVGGLTTAEIAAAFLVPEATMAQRISRAKQRIRTSGVPFRMPSVEEWPGRLRSVLHVLYLIFNEGYTGSDGRLAGHHRLHATRAHLLEMRGDRAAAAEHYRTAARPRMSLPERHYLIGRAGRLAE